MEANDRSGLLRDIGTRAYGGTGIGLSIVKAIMDAHNQQYGVKNWENGVEFWFTLDGSNS